MHFDAFTTPALPGDIETYKEYRRLTIEFVKARNLRINRWAISHGLQTPGHYGAQTADLTVDDAPSTVRPPPGNTAPASER